MKKVLVVGSSLIDLFLRPDESHSIITNDHVSLLLGDKVPTEIDKLSLGGNGANVSVGLARLGISTSFYTWLGNDILSTEIEHIIEKEGLELLTEEVRSGRSGLSVILNFGKDRIIFSHHETKNHVFAPPTIEPDLIYLTSVGDTWKEAYETVIEFAEQTNAPLAFSPGSKQIENVSDTIIKTLSKTTLLFVNKQEANSILKYVGEESENIKTILSNLSLLGPKIVSVTDGTKGAFAKNAENEFFQIAALANDNDINKAGAGDAYASGFLTSYLLGNDIPTAMGWGSHNASSVMKKIGAQDGLLKENEMQSILNNDIIKGEILS
jgi:ribokinase